MPSPQLSNPSILAGMILLVVLSMAGMYWLQTPAPPPPAPPIVPVASRAPAEAPPLTVVDTSTQILELFNPSDHSLTRQHNESTRTQQIEQVLTLSFVLTRCELISESEYSSTFRALILHAQHIGLASDATSAELRLRQMAESASASYALVYSRTDCDSPQLPELRRQLLSWQAGILTDR